MIFTPTVLFISGCTATTLIITLAAFATHYYIKAKEIAPYLLQLEEAQRRIAEAQTTLEEIKREIKEKQTEVAQAARLIADGHAAKEWLEREAPKVEALRTAVEAVQQKLKDATDAYQKRQGELNDLTQQVADKNTELKASTEKKNALDIETARLESETKSLEARIDAGNEYFKRLEAQVEQLTKARNTLDAQVKDLEKQAERLERQLKEDRLARDSAQQTLAQAKTELARVEGETNEKKRFIAQVDERRNTNHDCWKDLDAPYFANVQTPQASKLDEKKWLEQFHANLNASDLLFSERSLKAFHTGLKCADVSTLVVLAGISGTGKSLLPELYAAALGMNFLSVAVQPRWDSPQDLFGFYNYMEGRYKATELARFLWQFDRFNNPEAAKRYQRQVPMNIVLLDEMNLARVEYYFSDLLSKLETRSGIDPANAAQRFKAEVEIESSANSDKENRRRLFVGGNTLFVGTMNEDESTQTLSDKVIDRSNVLRFGRPKKLDAKPDKSKFYKLCDGVRVTEENWVKWRSENVQRVGRMKELLAPVNDALEMVGRPFAFRVSRAIERYVGFYPGNSEADFKAAVADQIEMKILPKLNGLELDVAGFETLKNTVGGIINGLNDEPLEKAFSSSCDKEHNAFFKWRGVMR